MLPKIIPTPHCIRTLAGSKTLLRNGQQRIVCLTGNQQDSSFGAAFLAQQGQKRVGGEWLNLQAVPSSCHNDDIVIACDAQGSLPEHWMAVLTDRERRVLADPLAQEQGYLLVCRNNLPLLLFAHSPQGCLYAVTSLLQLLNDGAKDGSITVPHVQITDRPNFRLRGNTWTSFTECGGWSYDWGDGAQAYEERILHKLDQCALYKINLIHLDGFGWNADRFRGFAAMMRRLNQAARHRGVHLQFGGYGSGYGVPMFYNSRMFRNRHTYPQGAVYSCMGLKGNATEHSRTMGTCLSNQGLLELKTRELVRFVQRVQPGSLYIHNLDCALISDSQKLWDMRCPDCRARWPNDDVVADDGMAGAFASFYDSFADAVNGVQDEATGYVAQRDCLLIMVSPGYTTRHESDADWQTECGYFAKVSRLMHSSNILFGLREQFVGEADPGGRYRRMEEAIQRDGNGHGILNYFFFGGDGFYNNLPFLATPILNRCFEGAAGVLHANGSAGQEPQQLLNAEYGWNPSGSAFHVEPIPKDPTRFERDYVDLNTARRRPRGIYMTFLRRACDELYGPKAGALIARLYRLRGKSSIAEVAKGMRNYQQYDRVSILLPIWNVLLPSNLFGFSKMQWHRDVEVKQLNCMRLMVSAYLETIELNRQGETLVQQAHDVCESGTAVQDELTWMADTLKVGRLLMEFMIRYIELFEIFWESLNEGKRPEEDATQRLTELRRELQRWRTRQLSIAHGAIDLLGGEWGSRIRVADILLRNLDAMRKTARTNVWPNPPNWKVW